MKKLIILLSLASILSPANLLAQKAPVKFGKVSKDEIEMVVYDQDSSAAAVILCDFATVKFTYFQGEGFKKSFDRNLRIKILKKEGYHWAKHEIDIHKEYDHLSKLRAYTFNLVNNKITKTKLSKEEIFTEDYSRYWKEIKFEMPAVQVGSVIDMEYTISSKSAYINDWYFQTEIPTAHSEYCVSIPEYYYYKQLEIGYFPIGEKSTTKRNQSINLTNKTRAQGDLANPTSYTHSTVNYLETQYFFRSTDVPAFKVEDYISCKQNYLSGIKFEIATVKWPNEPVENYTATWPAIGSKLMFDSDFGGRIKGGGIARSQVKDIKDLNLEDEQKIEAATNLVKNNITWNKKNGIYSYSSSDAWNEGKGNCADINLLLTAILRDLNLDANPVILSTRSHGMIHPAQLILNQYNYVIASVNYNGKTILIDATDKYTPIGVLPERCLNGQGRLINQKGGEWVNLEPTESYTNNYTLNFAINSEGHAQGKSSEKYDGYAAINKRNALLFYTSEEDFMEKYQETNKFEMHLDSITNRQNISEPLAINYTFENENISEKMGNLLLIDPILLAKETNNPFKLHERTYPVDFSYPRSTSYVATLTIPEGYAIDYLPEPKRIVMPNNVASYLYSIQNNQNKIIIVSRLKIKKTTFIPDEYQNLKEFYNQLIDTQSKKIILKKI